MFIWKRKGKKHVQSQSDNFFSSCLGRRMTTRKIHARQEWSPAVGCWFAQHKLLRLCDALSLRLQLEFTTKQQCLDLYQEEQCKDNQCFWEMIVLHGRYDILCHLSETEIERVKVKTPHWYEFWDVIFNVAIKYNQLQILRLAHENGGSITTMFSHFDAYRTKNMKLISWYVKTYPRMSGMILHIAILHQDEKTVKCVLSNGIIDIFNANYCTLASMKGRLSILKLLVEHHCTITKDCCMYACMGNHMHICEYLMKMKAPIDWSMCESVLQRNETAPGVLRWFENMRKTNELHNESENNLDVSQIEGVSCYPATAR